MIRVAIAEDHPEMRIALRMLLRLSEKMVLVCEMSTGTTALDSIRQFKPDILIMDTHMPALDGLEAARQIMAQGVDTRVILISSSRGSSSAMRALGAGARGFIPKEEAAAFLLPAIEIVHRGETFFVA